MAGPERNQAQCTVRRTGSPERQPGTSPAGRSPISSSAGRGADLPQRYPLAWPGLAADPCLPAGSNLSAAGAKSGASVTEWETAAVLREVRGQVLPRPEARARPGGGAGARLVRLHRLGGQRPDAPGAGRRVRVRPGAGQARPGRGASSLWLTRTGTTSLCPGTGHCRRASGDPERLGHHRADRVADLPGRRAEAGQTLEPADLARMHRVLRLVLVGAERGDAPGPPTSVPGVPARRRGRCCAGVGAEKVRPGHGHAGRGARNPGGAGRVRPVAAGVVVLRRLHLSAKDEDSWPPGRRLRRRASAS